MTVLALGLAFGSAACALPKFTAGSGDLGPVTPQPDKPPASDTVVVPSGRKKHKVGDVILVYAVALIVVALIYLKVDNTDAH